MSEWGQVLVSGGQRRNPIGKTSEQRFRKTEHTSVRRMSPNKQEQFVKLQQRFSVELEASECRQSGDNCFRVALVEAAFRIIQSLKETVNNH
jgi:hypothetical protein